jgi:hypothetical protein
MTPDFEELLDDDVEQMTVILATKEILDVRPKKRKGSTMGLCIPRNCALGHNLLMRDYFAEVPTYPPPSLFLPVPNATIFVQQDCCCV